jgi:GAF domain-containing protein
MSATADQELAELRRANAELQRANAKLQKERDAALADAQARTTALAQRDSEYGERIEQQAATIDVLKVMSSSPGDAGPVFKLIVDRARAFCRADNATAAMLDGNKLRLEAQSGMTGEAARIYEAQFPRPVSTDSIFGRSIIGQEPVQVPDVWADPDHYSHGGGLSESRAVISVPLLRGGTPIGAMTLGRRVPGEFSVIQVELLQTFANQAVIAITSAETYRALQNRTNELQQSLGYQTAISDVLKVISRSAFDLQPVLDTVVEAAARLCDADQAIINRREGVGLRLVASFGAPPEYEAHFRSHGLVSVDAPTASARAASERRPVHIHDVTTVPGYPEARILLGKQRTSLGVPLLREEEVIGTVVLARRRVEPFTDRQIDLVQTFADQAVIAIENTRLITEQREALEQQTAVAEVLQVINASPGDLAPVFDAILEKALALCGADRGIIRTYNGDAFHMGAMRGIPTEIAELMRAPRRPPFTGMALGRLVAGEPVVELEDITNQAGYRAGAPTLRAMADTGGARTGLWVALRKDDALLGLIWVYRLEVKPFTRNQVALLQNFAAQAVIAMENARLLTEQREALEQQTAMSDVLQIINASPGNLGPVFEAILEKAARLCDVEFGHLRTWDGERFHFAASYGGRQLAEWARRREPFVPHGHSPLGRIVSGERVVQIADALADPAYQTDAGLRALTDASGFRSGVAVALRKDVALLGAITVFSRVVGSFSGKQVALLENFAAQAVIAMENARLLNEQREALEQQTATAEVLQVINASPGDLMPVFDAMLEKAMRLCGAAYGELRSFDGERLRILASRGVPSEYAEFLTRHSRSLPSGTPPAPGTSIIQALQTGLPAQGLDARESAGYKSGNPGGRAIADLGGARTVLHVPLVKDQGSIGLLTFYRREVRSFSEKQIALMQNFAAQAVIAMENARLINETREALERQTATAEVLQVINSSPGDLAPVFDAILEKAHRLCEAPCGSLQIFDGERFRAVAVRGFAEPYAQMLRQGFHPAAATLNQREAIQVDMAELLAGAPGAPSEAILQASVEIAKIRTVMFVPLRREEILLGRIVAARQEVRPFSDKQIALLQNFAAQAVIAMENARLLNELRQRQEELRITFENMGDGVALFDESSLLVAWNRKFQEMFALPDLLLEQHGSYEELLRFLAARGDYGAQADVEALIHRLTTTTDQLDVYERERPDGHILEIRRNPVPSGGFVLIFADITERKRSEAEIRAARDAAEAAYRDLKAAQASLIQAEKMASLGQLTAGIAHEIKNPLNFVNNFASLSVDLLDELKQSAAPGLATLDEARRAEVDDLASTLASNLDKINEHGKRADGIVRSMLEHSRGSSGERRSVDLNALVDEALNLAYHGARAQDQSFSIMLQRDLDEGIAPITLAPQDITRVLLNLFSNGFYAAGKRQRMEVGSGFEPTLLVSTRDLGDAVEIRVRDNGIGIPAEIKDKLFQPFFTTKPTGEGTGLGLSISYDIVTQQHGGSIAVDSTVGEYSEFTIRLPRNP